MIFFNFAEVQTSIIKIDVWILVSDNYTLKYEHISKT